MSLRRAVLHGGLIIGYGIQEFAAQPDQLEEPADSPPKKAERILNHSTLWWMMAWLGVQSPALQEALVMILACDPLTDCHRDLGAVSPHKFRSPQRRQVLEQARRLLHVMGIWEKLFREKFFPRFATRSGFS